MSLVNLSAAAAGALAVGLVTAAAAVSAVLGRKKAGSRTSKSASTSKSRSKSRTVSKQRGGDLGSADLTGGQPNQPHVAGGDVSGMNYSSLYNLDANASNVAVGTGGGGAESFDAYSKHVMDPVAFAQSGGKRQGKRRTKIKGGDFEGFNESLHLSDITKNEITGGKMRRKYKK